MNPGLEQADAYETKLFVHDLLQRMDKLEKRMKLLEQGPPNAPNPSSPSPVQPRTPDSYLTRLNHLESLRSPKGGWNKFALAEIGVPWPPPHGWKQHYLSTGQPWKNTISVAASAPTMAESHLSSQNGRAIQRCKCAPDLPEVLRGDPAGLQPRAKLLRRNPGCTPENQSENVTSSLTPLKPALCAGESG